MSLRVGECKYLNWKWNKNAVSKGSYMDGSCLWHSILSILSSKYRTMKKEDQIELCKELRQSFANNLAYEKFLSLRIQKKFLSEDDCYKGHIDKGKDAKDPKVRYEAFKKYIADFRQHVGIEVFQLIAEEFDLDIYLMREGEHVAVLIPTSVAYLKRNSIILLCEGNHYEPIGIVRPSDESDRKNDKGDEKRELVDFVFHHSHPSIEDLYEKQKKAWETYVSITYEENSSSTKV